MNNIDVTMPGFAKWVRRTMSPNTVVRQACDRHGRVLGYFTAAFDGTPESMVTAAQRVSDDMFLALDEVSNSNSRILATDESGWPRWTISPNFRVIEDVG